MLRSGQGAHFALAIHEHVDLPALLPTLGVPLVATALEGAQDLYACLLYTSIFLGANLERNQIDLFSNSPLAYRNFVDQYGDSTNSVIFTAGWSNDTRDSALAPTKGSYTRLKSDFSTVDLKYYMLTGQQQYFIPLGNSYTLALNGMVDWGQSYGGKDYPIIKDVYALSLIHI